jgi:hypothetical protein
LTLVPNPERSHIYLYRGVSKLLRKDRPILSDFTYILFSRKVQRFFFFGNPYYWKLPSEQNFALTNIRPNPSTKDRWESYDFILFLIHKEI